MSFLYAFLQFFQPGIVWPAIAVAKPMFIAALVGLAAGLARRPAYPRAAALAHPILLWMLAFIAAQVVSLHYAGLPTMTTEGLYWITYPLFVLVSVLLINRVAALKRYVAGMMAGGLFLVCFGILAVWLGWPEAAGGRAGAFGMYENHNDYSFVIIQVVPFLYAYRHQSRGLLTRFLLLAALGACVLGMFMSLSRGGMLALMIEFFLIVLLAMRSRRRWLLLPVLALVAAAAIHYQWSEREENQGARYTVEQAEYLRYELWRTARNMVEAHPWLGVGSRRFSEFSQQYGELSHDNRGKVTHNTYLEVLAGSGLIGFIPFVMMLWAIHRELRKKPAPGEDPWIDATRRAALIAFYAVLFRGMLDAKPHDLSFYMLGAIAMACALLARGHDAVPAAAVPGRPALAVA